MSRTNPNPPTVLIVQGVIGSGKSTLLGILKSDLPKYGKEIVVIREPVEIWQETGALTDFYANISAMAVEFQMFAFITRIKEVLKAYQANPNADIYIIERDPHADKIFMKMLRDDGYVSEQRYKRYLMTWEGWMKHWPFVPTHTLYLAPSLEKCMERVRSRAREGETTVSLDYQTNLQLQHEEFLSKCETPLLRVVADNDFRPKDSHERNQLVNQVASFIGIKLSRTP